MSWPKRLLIGAAGLILVLAAVIALVPTARNLAIYATLSQVTLSHFEVDGSKLEMTGAVNGKSPEQLEQVLDDHPEISTFVLEDVGGSIDDDATFEMARLIRSRGLATRSTTPTNASTTKCWARPPSTGSRSMPPHPTESTTSPPRRSIATAW